MSTKTKKEKVEFIRTEQFEAVDDELGNAMSALDEANTRILDLLGTEARGDLPGLDSPPIDAPGATPVYGESDDPPAPAKAPGTPRVRKARRKEEVTPEG